MYLYTYSKHVSQAVLTTLCRDTVGSKKKGSSALKHYVVPQKLTTRTGILRGLELIHRRTMLFTCSASHRPKVLAASVHHVHVT